MQFGGLRHDGAHNGVLQRDQRFGRLDLVDGLDLVDKYLLQRVDRSAHHLDKDAVVAGGVIGFHHFFGLSSFVSAEG